MSDHRYDVEIQKWNEKSGLVLSNRKDWKCHGSYDTVFTENNTLRPVHEFFIELEKPGTVLLDYGCGQGWTSLLLAQKAEKVKAIDISEMSIAVLKRYAEFNKIDNIEAQAGDAEALPYNDNEFDYVFGNAILHHLTLERCIPEIARVLKPGGYAAFCEPFDHNPLIRLFRYIKHHFIETHLGTDKPLKYSDKALFEKYFSNVAFVESSFLSDRSRHLKGIDRFLLNSKLLRRYASYVTILLQKGC